MSGVTDTGQHWSITTREEVQGIERRHHELSNAHVRLEARVNALERDLREAEDHYRDRDRGVRQFGLWALGLLVTLAVTFVGGVITLNGQIARLEERVEALREQVQASNRPAPPRWQGP
jgi:outer membrane murein-binding lipoprotein Lpp